MQAVRNIKAKVKNEGTGNRQANRKRAKECRVHVQIVKTDTDLPAWNGKTGGFIYGF